MADAVGMVAWSFTGVFVKLATVSGLALPFYRLWLGLLLTLCAALAARKRLSWRVLRASLLGGLFFCADVALFFAALKRTSVADVTFIGALQPVLVLLVATRWFGERLTYRQLAWMVLALAGVALVVLGGPGLSRGDLLGDLLAVGALLAWTGYWLASKHARSRLGTVEYMAGMLLVASVALTPLTLATGAALGIRAPLDWLWIGLLGFIPSGGHFLFNRFTAARRRSHQHRYRRVALSGHTRGTSPRARSTRARVRSVASGHSTAQCAASSLATPRRQLPPSCAACSLSTARPSSARS